MLQTYPKAQDNTTIKWKKLILEACLGVFVPFCSFFEHFWGPKSKNIRFFAGIDLEWHETHFEMKISRKRSFLVQILSSCNLQKVSFMAADVFTWSFLPNVHYSFVGACQTAFRHPTRLPYTYECAVSILCCLFS